MQVATSPPLYWSVCLINGAVFLAATTLSFLYPGVASALARSYLDRIRRGEALPANVLRVVCLALDEPTGDPHSAERGSTRPTDTSGRTETDI
jgi:hypothetical protein